jgi:signal transduction histidine kinase
MDGHLHERVPTKGKADEFDRLADNLNAMLDRIQQLMQGLHQVSSDIAHDLRTPLSHMRQRLELARLKAASAQDYDAAVDRAVTDIDGILGVFAALLRIAQIEAGARREGFAPVDLSGLFETIIDTYGPVADDVGHRLAGTVAPGLSIRGDRQLLTQMLANLVENTIRHTPAGTEITVSLMPGPAGPVGIVRDTGPGIPETAREKVFQRFFRLDASRMTPGSGLGLSLVSAVAQLHDVRVTLSDNHPGLAVTLDFADLAKSQAAGSAGRTAAVAAQPSGDAPPAGHRQGVWERMRIRGTAET